MLVLPHSTSTSELIGIDEIEQSRKDKVDDDYERDERDDCSSRGASNFLSACTGGKAFAHPTAVITSPNKTLLIRPV